MSTFLEFYLSLLKFVNFKLFSDLKEAYPVRASLYDANGNIDVASFKPLQTKIVKAFLKEERDQDFQISEEYKQTPEMREIAKKQELASKQRDLFKSFHFFFNREVPLYVLQYLVLSFGATYSYGEDSAKISHHVLDRPLTAEQKKDLKSKNRELIQPQWIADSINAVHNLPVQEYFPGVPPPAHLSPFVDNQREGYMPERQKQINRIKGEEMDEDEEEEEVVEKIPEKKKKKEESEEEEESDSEESDEEEEKEIPAEKYVSSSDEEPV
jgi:pescadillo protein